MPLEQEKIVANTKKYFDTATKLGFMNEELMNNNWLSTITQGVI
jgi:hypothetical protein